MSGIMRENDPDESFEPEDDGSLQYWMWCEEQEVSPEEYECDGQPDEAQEWHDFDPDC